ncbi:hypothetical protein YC2023_009382 [Brassica napus]
MKDGPDHVDLETSSCPLWLTFEQALSSMKNRRGINKAALFYDTIVYTYIHYV